MTFSTIIAFAFSMAYLVGFFVLWRQFPVTESEPCEKTLDQLEPLYRKWSLLFGAIHLIAATGGILAIWCVLIAFEALHSFTLPRAEFTFRPDALIWFMPAFIAGTLLSHTPSMLVGRRIMGSRWHELEQYEKLRLKLFQHPGLNRIVRLLMKILIGGAALFIFLFMDWYVLVTPEQFVVNEISSMRETRHPLSSIQKIQTAPKLIAPNGNLVKRREYQITFSDNYTWTTNFSPKDLDKGEKQSFLKQVSEWSGKPIEEIKVFRLNGFSPMLLEQ